jgi:hypothetical protein
LNGPGRDRRLHPDLRQAEQPIRNRHHQPEGLRRERQPELRANKLDFDTFNKSLVTMQQIGSQQEAISQALSVNARQLERMIDRLEEDKK